MLVSKAVEGGYTRKAGWRLLHGDAVRIRIVTLVAGKTNEDLRAGYRLLAGKVG